MRITIVGMGLMGASIAKGLDRKKHQIYGIDKDIENIDYCLKNNIIDRGTVNPRDVLEETDLLIMAIYPQGMIDFISNYKNHLKKGVVVTDICGVKTAFLDRIQEIMPKETEFVGAHPMAGREKIGPMYSSKDIFIGANFIITPTDKNTVEAIRLVRGVANELRFKRITEITPEKHDKMIGFTSQLTHAIAVALVNSDRFEDTKCFTGDSYRELTRIAMINEDLWTELFLENKMNLVSMIEIFQEELELVKKAISNEDRNTLRGKFKSSTNKRRELEREV